MNKWTVVYFNGEKFETVEVQADAAIAEGSTVRFQVNNASNNTKDMVAYFTNVVSVVNA